MNSASKVMSLNSQRHNLTPLVMRKHLNKANIHKNYFFRLLLEPLYPLLWIQFSPAVELLSTTLQNLKHIVLKAKFKPSA